MAMAVFSGINCEAVHRLKHSFRELPQDVKKILLRLEDFANPSASYARYRSVYRAAKPPCIPYIGIYLRDLAFLEKTMPSYIGKKINFAKCRALYQVIEEVLQYQDMPYKFYPVHQIRILLTNFKTLITDPNILYKVSLAAEPRGAESVE